MSSQSVESEKHVVIVGVGLIGGSIAAAVQKRHPSCRVTGVGRNPKRLEEAVQLGLISDFETDSTDALTPDCLVVVCLPVEMIGREVCRLARSQEGNIAITDAGSVKKLICDEVMESQLASAIYLGAHPIAGGETAGYENSDAELFENRSCVLTPTSQTNPEIRKRVDSFWTSLGCITEEMAPEKHDTVLALTSHLPHLMAAVTTSVVGESLLPWTGSGFRDTTRIAAGNPNLWTQIFTSNRSALLSAIETAKSYLDNYQSAIDSNDTSEILKLLAGASECRVKVSQDSDSSS